MLLGCGLLDWWRWKHSLLQNVATTHPVTQHYKTENLNPQQQCSENFKSGMLSSITMNMWCRKPRNQVITTTGTMPCQSLSLFSHTTFLTTSEPWMSLALVFEHPSHQHTINMLPHGTQEVTVPWILNPLCCPNMNRNLRKRAAISPCFMSPSRWEIQ